ncbi:MAG: ATP-binding protein [Planctomycetota bacterium]|nr:ATP-binding protein [Planctomycetota bacterium]MDA1178395.1 ATP-binding protein [Planctomycetota bacterium]
MKLAAKVMLALLATVVVLTAVGSYLSVRAIYAEFETEQQNYARHLATELQGKLEAAWRVDGVDGVLRVLDGLSLQSGRLLQVRWVWFDSQAQSRYRPAVPPQHWMGTTVGELVSVLGTDAAGHRSLHTYLPLPLRDAPWHGGLEITESLATVDNHTRRTAWMAFATIASVAVVCLSTSYLAGWYWVAHPLELLIAKTQRVGAGDFSRPLHLPGRDELSQLARAINEMCERLAAQHTTILQEIEQRATALDQLRHADRLKTVGRLAAGIAHELGTPLNIIAGRAALISNGKLHSEEVMASAQTIKSEADRITAIVRQLLDFARQRPPQHRKGDIRNLLLRTSQLLQPLAEKQHVTITTTSLHEEIPAWFDEGQIQQVVTNMVMNSIQAMPQGGTVELAACRVPRVPISGELSANASSICISVADNGPGIAHELQGQLFEPFFTTKDVGSGTGLGLSIAYGIVREHGGSIHVTSKLGHGAQFDIHLPPGDVA